jgi:hypothetical protein
MPADAPHFRGGIRRGNFTSGVNDTWPLARLDVFSNGLRIGPSTRFVRPLVPTWEVQLDELTESQVITCMGSKGVRFRASDPADWIVFWTFRPSEVISYLSGHGVNVNEQVRRVPFRHPDR